MSKKQKTAMNKRESRVAICPKCKGIYLAASLELNDAQTDREFRKAKENGHEVQYVTSVDVRSEKWHDRDKCDGKATISDFTIKGFTFQVKTTMGNKLTVAYEIGGDQVIFDEDGNFIGRNVVEFNTVPFNPKESTL